MRRIALAIGIAAAFAMGGGAPVSGRMLRVPLCHGGVLDLPVKGEKPGRDKTCPFGCHAPLCQDKKKRMNSG